VDEVGTQICLSPIFSALKLELLLFSIKSKTSPSPPLSPCLCRILQTRLAQAELLLGFSLLFVRKDGKDRNVSFPPSGQVRSVGFFSPFFSSPPLLPAFCRDLSKKHFGFFPSPRSEYRYRAFFLGFTAAPSGTGHVFVLPFFLFSSRAEKPPAASLPFPSVFFFEEHRAFGFLFFFFFARVRVPATPTQYNPTLTPFLPKGPFLFADGAATVLSFFPFPFSPFADVRSTNVFGTTPFWFPLPIRGKRRRHFLAGFSLHYGGCSPLSILSFFFLPGTYILC